MPFQRQRYEIRVQVQGEARVLRAFVGDVRQVEAEARAYYTRACEHMKDNVTTEWFTTDWTEVSLLGPNGQYLRSVRPHEDPEP